MTATALWSTSAAVRVSAVLNEWFARYGRSPSYREIGAIARVAVSHVGGHLDRLQEEGVLTHQRGVARSIVMIRRLANVSDDEIELECRARRWAIARPSAEAAATIRDAS